MGESNGRDDRERWARLRFAVVGPLLASPPPKGRLQAELERLSQQDWEHPSGKGPVRFSATTIERWYYQARSAHQDPVKALQRQSRGDAGRARAMSAPLIAALRDQHRAHPSWSMQLHYDNLQALVDADPSLGRLPSYTTVTRVMHALGLVRRRRRRRFDKTETAPRVETRELLSYEVERSHALWHSDFHHGKCRVLTAAGEWKTPILLGFLDDHSRLGCHLQWYLSETAEVFVHGLCQALMKRGLPRSLMTDNGAPMMAGEVQEGLHRLGIVHATTLAYSPYQNGKCEVWWSTSPASSRPGAGRRTARSRIASRPRSCWSPAGGCSSWTSPTAPTGTATARRPPTVRRPRPPRPVPPLRPTWTTTSRSEWLPPSSLQLGVGASAPTPFLLLPASSPPVFPLRGCAPRAASPSGAHKRPGPAGIGRPPQAPRSPIMPIPFFSPAGAAP